MGFQEIVYLSKSVIEELSKTSTLLNHTDSPRAVSIFLEKQSLSQIVQFPDKITWQLVNRSSMSFCFESTISFISQEEERKCQSRWKLLLRAKREKVTVENKVTIIFLSTFNCMHWQKKSVKFRFPRQGNRLWWLLCVELK